MEELLMNRSKLADRAGQSDTACSVSLDRCGTGNLYG